VKKLHIISIQEEYLGLISRQMKEVMGDMVTISPITIKDLKENIIHQEDIVILSNDLIKGLASHYIPDGCPCIIAKRDINIANTKEIIEMEPGKNILVINDTRGNAEETVESLRNTFFEHQYFIYNPLEPVSKNIDCIITPGENNLVPQNLKQVIDIGPRLLEIGTFLEIADLLDHKVELQSFVKRYIKSLVSLSEDSTYIVANKKTIAVKTIKERTVYTFSEIVANSLKMKKAIMLANSFCNTKQAIHVQGEIGTGKKMVAQAIHHETNNAKGPFISVNCSSLPKNQLEKELFGEEMEDIITIGLIEQATKGTLYIAEIEEMPIPVQKRLSQMIESNRVIKVNGTTSEPIQTRIITSSYYSLEDLVNSEKLLHSLYYQLASFTVHLPSLSERIEDFDLLIEDIKKRLNREQLTIQPDALEMLKKHSWTGNVKELYNTITYLSSLGINHINVDSLPNYIHSHQTPLKGTPITNDTIIEIIARIEEHGFLDESVRILKAFADGKKERVSFGRITLKKILETQNILLSEQQLRIRLEILEELSLLNVRQGRAGTTISRFGEEFLAMYDLQHQDFGVKGV
jgi:sigma-54 dependent transcriptional regulator, acetoin dehydrogenase operon transcriptional activator AcoR